MKTCIITWSFHFTSLTTIFKTVMESFMYFQQFCNNSFICGIHMLLKHVTKPWSHCKLVSYFVCNCWTFSNKQDQNTALIVGTESEVFLNKHALSASLLFEAETVLIQSRLNNDYVRSCLLRTFMEWSNYYLLCHLFSGKKWFCH